MNIILCGFMGCGKSTVGRRAAKRLGLEFVDMDAYIESAAGLKISEIFEKYGEEHFRRLEAEAAKELSEKSGLLIATGGGAVLNPGNVAAFKKSGVIVLLQISAETVIGRLKNSTTRPLLMREDRETVIRELMENRKSAYENAASVIVNANLDMSSVVSVLVQMVKKYLD